MHIDLTSLPPLSLPTPPSNTVLVTQLTNPTIFDPSTLSTLRNLLTQHAHAPIHTFTPLKSMRRIIISFFAIEPAIALREVLDGECILGCRVRVYFGVNTNIKTCYNGDNNNNEASGENVMEYLKPPDKGRLFFISPPPSPPLGWTGRDEGAPNKQVHAEDLAIALAKIRSGRADNDNEEIAAVDIMDQEADVSTADANARQQLIGIGSSNAKLVYHPSDHGSRADLPTVLVEDVSNDHHININSNINPDQAQQRILTHTARPPVELMLDHHDTMDMDMDTS